ncbi:MAG: hypothetical protein A3J24_12120 [Deltaproteobacteria bacterium RIFCSPLOWO2_02_FULL_53_8]|nr:MAG: hypothetical protein A3J24_12120 [Deltaproteobacteria bacterium RIFCSPLOWO2_02_FULL_53_8]
MDAIEEYNALIDGVIERLESLRDAGVEYVPKSIASIIDAQVNIICAAYIQCAPNNEKGMARLFFVRGLSTDANGEADDRFKKMITRMGLIRDDVYVTQAFKSGPEVTANKLSLDEEIKKVSPRVIVLLGPVAAMSLLGSEDIAGLRGRFHDYNGIKVMPSYEPASLAERKDLIWETWADMQMVMKELKGGDGGPD